MKCNNNFPEISMKFNKALWSLTKLYEVKREFEHILYEV